MKLFASSRAASSPWRAGRSSRCKPGRRLPGCSAASRCSSASQRGRPTDHGPGDHRGAVLFHQFLMTSTCCSSVVYTSTAYSPFAASRAMAASTETVCCSAWPRRYFDGDLPLCTSVSPRIRGNGRAALVGTLELFFEVAAAAVAHEAQVRQGIAQALCQGKASLFSPSPTMQR